MDNNTIVVKGSSDMDALKRKMILQKINELPTDQLTRLGELSEIPKAKSYLESAAKFMTLKVLLK
ncbi:hypothetical protein [Flavobacterium capsici]|uniref:Uncharacterized protein n=1 Tax=Flavobacterium capsici TaxID=3075618 RepID=A0AA96F3F6_9FLAO|nr:MULTISPECIES: hypothetical protein [unclassified Flavobacterium]WNM19277.1 hypothetical protein RN608_01010 [Flavobacterium sp. PMR2A8]WNM20666.1 hypothetical protein RN605_08180 [Flavobacterium sp. PMTSA4]